MGDERARPRHRPRRSAASTSALGRPARRDSEYLRNGTQNLFAALEVHSGAVSGMTAATRNQFDFITCLDQLEAEIPVGQRVIAILDNLSTHKTQGDEAISSWRARDRHADLLGELTQRPKCSLPEVMLVIERARG